jgi:hypothetical protein
MRVLPVAMKHEPDYEPDDNLRARSQEMYYFLSMSITVQDVLDATSRGPVPRPAKDRSSKKSTRLAYTDPIFVFA